MPSLRIRYLTYVRDIATTWLDWNKVGPLAQNYYTLITEQVKAHTRKLATFDAFEKGLVEDTEEQTFRGPRTHLSLKTFVEKRRAFLLDHPAIQQLSATTSASH